MNDYLDKPFSGILIIIGSLLILICMILDIVAYSKFSFSSNTLLDFSDNFKQQPIIDIKSDFSTCSPGYENLISDNWPGYVQGCDCTSAFSYYVSNEIHRDSCTFNETVALCKDLQYQSPIPLSVYRQTNLCIKRTNSDYINYSSKISRDYNCPSGKKLCGKIDTAENYLCLNEGEICPINKIVFQKYNSPAPNDKIYNKISLGNGIILYFSNQNVTKNDYIITELKLSEDFPCINKDRINTRNTLNKYILDADYFKYGCSQFLEGKYLDDRYTKLDSLNYYDMLKDNKINFIINNYPQVPSSSINYKVELYNRPYYGWKASCIKDKQYGLFYIIELNTQIQTLSSKLITMLVMSIITFILYLVCVGIFFAGEKNVCLIFLIVILILNLVMMIISFTTFSLSKYISSTNSELITLNCGDKFINLFIKYLYDFIVFLPGVNIWNSILLIVNIILIILPVVIPNRIEYKNL